MSTITKDDGVIVAMMEQFERSWLPRALALKTKVDKGGRLDDTEIVHLLTVLSDFQDIQQRVDARPDLQVMFAQAVSVYESISNRALQNETGAVASA
jgi:hypothetical protein